MENSVAASLVGPEQYYFDQLAHGVFEIQQCTTCARHQFFPRILCVHCGSEDLVWVAPSGRGEVYSYSIVSRKPEAGGDYNVVLVDLEEQVRLMGRLEGVVLSDIHIGQQVTARIAQQDGNAILVFDAVEKSHA